MSTHLIFDNVVAYSLQIGMLVGMAAFVPVLLRLKQPAAKLFYWQILLAACLLLPLQPWHSTVAAGIVQVTATNAVTPFTASAPARFYLPPRSGIALLMLLAGMVARLAWLAVGFCKLYRYRRRSVPLEPAPAWSVEASLRVCDDVVCPVTFGWRKPVVLLPAGFTDLNSQAQEAILCHEVMHVRRRDWLFTVAEELVRAAFWFHPAIWWLLGEIGLAREQQVDRLVIDITREREHYMDALLAIAGSRTEPDLALAPLFLRKRHLKHRVVMILEETRMSKRRLISALVAGLGVLAAACWLVMGAFPLTAEPQIVNDAIGVSVNLNGAEVMHRSGVSYPREAILQGVQGAVQVEVRTDAAGNVVDTRVLSGPDELRKAVIQSVLDWHFTRGFASTTRTIAVTFEAPKQVSGTQMVVTPNSVPGVAGNSEFNIYNNDRALSTLAGVVGVQGVIRSAPTAVPPPPPPPPPPSAADLRQVRVGSVRIVGLPEHETAELLAALPVHEGDEWTDDLANRTRQTVRAFDEHLGVSEGVMRSQDGALSRVIMISAPGSRAAISSVTPQAVFRTPTPGSIRIGGNVQAAKILRKATPIYPALAKAARVSGVVHLDVVVAKDGTMQEVHSSGGPALLIQAAIDAVQQWVYEPTILNGQPVAVETTVDVNFTLNQ